MMFLARMCLALLHRLAITRASLLHSLARATLVRKDHKARLVPRGQRGHKDLKVLRVMLVPREQLERRARKALKVQRVVKERLERKDLKVPMEI